MNRSITGYRSHTLQANNRRRLAFLPCFPSTENKQPEEILLLTNVPVTMLSTAQFERRLSGTFPRQFEYIENKHIRVPSFMKFIYRSFLLELSEKWKIDQSILDFNLLQLKEITQQNVVLHRHSDSHSNMAYHMHEWPMALEIFLQIDVDSLFMKTCSFRGSHPRLMDENMHGSISEGLFCLHAPDTRYLMLPCTNSSCPCCYQSLDISCRREPSVQFALEQAHQFVNGYQVYLNCHATCKTTGFIYVLTCPCGQFDYVGSSHHPHESFKDILFYHRRESVRILHEFLLGEKIIKRTFDMYEREKTIEEKKVDQMRLYQHLTECSAALQLLLNRCGYYWYLVPLEMEEADQEDLLFRMTCINQSPDEKEMVINSSSSQNWSPCERTDQEVEWCLANVPKTPDGTRFSRLQLHQQKLFFKNGSDRLSLPPRHLDIFNMTIVFVLPEDCSQLLCQVIESLLITHTECKLNTHLLLAMEHSSTSPTWYKNLVGRVYPS